MIILQSISLLKNTLRRQRSLLFLQRLVSSRTIASLLLSRYTMKRLQRLKLVLQRLKLSIQKLLHKARS
nr:MAG TPA: hypothetical protein [Caudoviricetes sp.]